MVKMADLTDIPPSGL
jgi:calpain